MTYRIAASLLVSVGLLACAPAPQPEVAGRALYFEHCAGCHGSGGQGDGPDAASVGVPVPDLTQISNRNGCTFPTVAVMSQIDGYRRERQGSITMPAFGEALLTSPRVLVDFGDGVETPTPEALVDLAAYLESIQR